MARAIKGYTSAAELLAFLQYLDCSYL